jgi:hypothetical protein
MRGGGVTSSAPATTARPWDCSIIKGEPNMSASNIRKFLTIVEETCSELGRPVTPPTRKAAALAVVENPCAGRDVDDLSPLIAIGEELGNILGRAAVAALGVSPSAVESYGKAAIVGEDGELEHAAAILHPKLGTPFRAAVEEGAALIPSAKKMEVLARRLMFRWAIRMRPSSAVISTRWRSESPMHRVAGRS